MYPKGYTTGDEDDCYPDNRGKSGRYTHGYPVGDEDGTADYLYKRRHGYGSGRPSADVPLGILTTFNNSTKQSSIK